MHIFYFLANPVISAEVLPESVFNVPVIRHVVGGFGEREVK